LLLAVVVGNEVDRVLVEILHHGGGGRGHARLCVAHGRGRIAVDGAEVSLAVDQAVAHVEVLRHADERGVHDGLAVRVVLTGRVAGDLRTLAVLRARTQVQVVHRDQHASLRRLQAIPHIGERSRNDHAHRVGQVGVLHLLFDEENLLPTARALGHQLLRSTSLQQPAPEWGCC
jgi:hypothetical protein